MVSGVFRCAKVSRKVWYFFRSPRRSLAMCVSLTSASALEAWSIRIFASVAKGEPVTSLKKFSIRNCRFTSVSANSPSLCSEMGKKRGREEKERVERKAMKKAKQAKRKVKKKNKNKKKKKKKKEKKKEKKEEEKKRSGAGAHYLS